MASKHLASWFPNVITKPKHVLYLQQQQLFDEHIVGCIFITLYVWLVRSNINNK